MRFLSIPTLVAALVAIAPLLAADHNPTWTEPEKARTEDPDFSVQGEYVGKLGEAKVGLHLVAEGEGKFAAVLYEGGLPGDGWSGDKKARKKGTAQTKDGKTTVEIDGKKATLAEGKISFENGTLERTERKSETLGAQAPAGAKVLFDGKDHAAFPGSKLDGDMLVQGITSKEKFDDFSLHIEFRVPYQPKARGQGRGNSGIYLQGRYEVQMLDSFGLEGQHNECGGIYSIKAPDLNMAYPPLAWQTYDIDFTAAKWQDGKKVANAKVTVKHNGVLIHKDVELTNDTTASPLKEGPESGPIHCQDHGNPVRYRNIWIVPKK